MVAITNCCGKGGVGQPRFLPVKSLGMVSVGFLELHFYAEPCNPITSQVQSLPLCPMSP